MRIAVISDIHGNLPALEAVLADVAKQAPDKVYCLGDLVGYGASPNEVSERNTLLNIEMEDQYPKDLRLFERDTFDFVITVCDRAAEQCPVFPGDPDRIHWGFEDPAAVAGSEQEQQRAFDLVAKQIAARVRVWMCLPGVRDAIELRSSAPR